jgi:TonB family protein
MKIIAALLLVLLAASPPPAEFARYMFGHLDAPIIECPQELAEEHFPKTLICARYSAGFGIFKADWEVNLRRHDLPERVFSISHWRLSDGRYIRDYEVDGEPLTFVFDEGNSRLVAAYRPGDDDDTDAVEPDEGTRRAPLEAGFGGVTLPRLISESKVEPLYPHEAKEQGLKGSVTLSLIINRDGEVVEATLLAAEPAGIGFEEAALGAVRQWRYEPSTYEGKPVTVRYTIYVRFDWTAP